MSFESRRPLSDQEHLSSDAARPMLARRFAFMMAVWRERVHARRCLARMDARSLREIGISPIASYRSRRSTNPGASRCFRT